MSDDPIEELRAIKFWSGPTGSNDERDWDDIFDRLLSFMGDDRPVDSDTRRMLSDEAAEKLGHAIRTEASERYNFAWPSVAVVRARLEPIFEALSARERRARGAIEAFSSGCLGLHAFHQLHQVLIVEWLQALQGTELDTPDRLIAEIRLWPWGNSPFRARDGLIPFLSDPTPLVRAVAANELGKTLEDLEVEFESEWARAWPVFEDVKRSEVARPGVAGPFLWGLPYKVREDLRVQQWVFDCVVERVGEEPEVPYFNSLEWIACDEVLTLSTKWIAALVAAGRKDLADRVAIDTRIRAPEVAQYLAEMTRDPDDWTARAAAANLALYYGRTTQDALSRGFVAHLDDHPLFSAFVIYDHDDLLHPRLASVHPRRPRRTFSVAEADAAVDALLPPRVRGDERPGRVGWRERVRRREFSDRVSVTYRLGAGRSQRVAAIEVIGNGVQGPGWNPIELWKRRVDA